MAQTFFPINPVEVTPGAANVWIDIDVSSYVPSGATGVILHLVNKGTTIYAIGLRKNGSTDNRYDNIIQTCHCWAAIGIDSNRVFEAYVGDITNLDIYLIGYTGTGVTFFTNAYNKTPSVGSSWQDIDCSLYVPSGAIGLIFEVRTNDPNGISTGLRNNGSSDNRTTPIGVHNSFTVIIGCDTSRKCEGYVSVPAYSGFWLVGYITDGCVFNLNATDISLGSTGAWTDLAALPSGAIMAFIEISSGGWYNYGLRQNGSSEDIYYRAGYHPWAFVQCDTSQIIEGKIENALVDFFVVGYAIGAVNPTVTTQAASSVEATTATGNGTITDTGGENCDQRGFEWGTSPGSYPNSAVDSGSFGTGAYTKSLTGLPSGTTIYYRAKAHNSAGWGYGSEVTFLTKPAAPTGVSATDGAYTNKVVITWTKSTGATGYQVYRDGVGLGWLGDVATYDDTGAGAPSITPGSSVASDGAYTDKVALSLSGTGTNNGTTHTYKVRAKNATGESADSSTDTGYRAPGALTYQWQRSAADSDADYSNISGATTASYNDTTAPAPTITPGSAAASDGTYTDKVALSLSGQAANVGAGRYYKCILNATGCAQQTSASNRGYRGVGTLTYQWQRSAADSDADYSNISGATTASYNDTGAPADGSGRYYRCVENATGAAQQTSTSNRGYRATYYSSGYIGDVIDCTALVDKYDRLEWAEELAGQNIEVKIRSSPDNATWSTWETIYSSPCTSFTTPVQRYLEWRATLTSDTTATPKLKDLAFYWSKKVA